jgi:hypothetical protein
LIALAALALFALPVAAAPAVLSQIAQSPEPPALALLGLTLGLLARVARRRKQHDPR